MSKRLTTMEQVNPTPRYTFWRNSLLGTAVVLVSFGAIQLSKADETVPEKIQNKSDEIHNDSEKAVRKHKRRVRKATGNDTIVKDSSDAAKDAAGDVSTEAKKLKRKAD